MTDDKKIERVNDKMVKVTINTERVFSNQQLYDLYASIKQREIQVNQSMRKLEKQLEEVRTEMAFLDATAKDCAKRIPSDKPKEVEVEAEK